jgi:Sister chromatid cohesion protein Dcc1
MLAGGGAFRAWHTLRTSCNPCEGCTGDDLRVAALASRCSDAAPCTPPPGSLLSWDRARVACEFAEQAVSRVAGRGASLGAVMDRGAALEAWRERMPAARCWPQAAGKADDDAADPSGGASTSAAAMQEDEAEGEDVDDGAANDALFAEALAGAAIEQLGSKGAKLLALPARTLSYDAKTRFEQLFAVKPQWRADEMEPYLATVYAEGCKNAKELLLRYTRVVRDQPDNAAMHCTR